jgi:hypothetical protein
MAQHAQLKAEIISALDSLSPDSLRLLVQFISFLHTDAAQAELRQSDEVIDVSAPQQTVRLTSPRLLHRHQVADLQKEIMV